MRRRTKLFCMGLMALGGAIFFGAGIHAKAQSGQSPMARHGSGAAGLIGAWRVTVSLQDCQTHAPIGNPFYSILTFASDGIVGGTTMSPAFLPGQRSPDFGTWRQTDWSAYSAVDESLIVFGGGPFTAGVQTLTHKITLSADGSQFTDDATTQFSDFIGTQTTPPPGCAAAVGKRLQ